MERCTRDGYQKVYKVSKELSDESRKYKAILFSPLKKERQMVNLQEKVTILFDKCCLREELHLSHTNY